MREPLAPVRRGAVHPLERLVEVLRPLVLGPRQRDERRVALAQRRAGGGPRALEADPQVGVQQQVDARLAAGRAGLVVGRARCRTTRAPPGRTRTPARTRAAAPPSPAGSARCARARARPPSRRARGAGGGRAPRRGATGRCRARRAPRASRCASSRSSRAPCCPAGSGARPAPARRPAPCGSGPRRGRGSGRRRWASRTAAGTATRRSRWARPARPPRSRTGTRIRRSAGSCCARSSAPGATL